MNINRLFPCFFALIFSVMTTSLPAAKPIVPVKPARVAWALTQDQIQAAYALCTVGAVASTWVSSRWANNCIQNFISRFLVCTFEPTTTTLIIRCNETALATLAEATLYTAGFSNSTFHTMTLQSAASQLTTLTVVITSSALIVMGLAVKAFSEAFVTSYKRYETPTRALADACEELASPAFALATQANTFAASPTFSERFGRSDAVQSFFSFITGCRISARMGDLIIAAIIVTLNCLSLFPSSATIAPELPDPTPSPVSEISDSSSGHAPYIVGATIILLFGLTMHAACAERSLDDSYGDGVLDRSPVASISRVALPTAAGAARGDDAALAQALQADEWRSARYGGTK